MLFSQSFFFFIIIYILFFFFSYIFPTKKNIHLLYSESRVEEASKYMYKSHFCRIFLFISVYICVWLVCLWSACLSVYPLAHKVENRTQMADFIKFDSHLSLSGLSRFFSSFRYLSIVRQMLEIY